MRDAPGPIDGGRTGVGEAGASFPGATEEGAPHRRPVADEGDVSTDFDAAFLEYVEWARSTQAGDGAERFWLETAAPFYLARQRRILEAKPELQDYPFLDPIGDRPSDPDLLTAFNVAVAEDLSRLLGDGLFWEGPGSGGDDSDRAREATRATLSDPGSLIGIPPSQLVTMPWYGDVDRERVVQQLPLLQSLRLEYLDAVMPFVVESLQLRGWRLLAQQPASDLPEELRLPGLDDYAMPRLKELDEQMEVYRGRYLRALGEAVGATELPPVD